MTKRALFWSLLALAGCASLFLVASRWVRPGPAPLIHLNGTVGEDKLRAQILSSVPLDAELPVALAGIEQILDSLKLKTHFFCGSYFPTRSGGVYVQRFWVDPSLAGAVARSVGFTEPLAAMYRRLTTSGKDEYVTVVNVDFGEFPYALGLLKRAANADFTFDEHQGLVDVRAHISQGLP